LISLKTKINMLNLKQPKGFNKVKPEARAGRKNNTTASKTINRIIYIVIIILGLTYLSIINDLSIKGYQIENLTESKNGYATANQDLELEITALSSYDNIISRVNDLKMVAVKNIDYLSAATIVAKK